MMASFFLQVAIICNHQRTISKSHDAQMSRLTEKIEELKVINFRTLPEIFGPHLLRNLEKI
jgi:DNA topoisomerase-1